jgi:site-specific recombinase XerD
MIAIRLYQRKDKVGLDGRAPIYYVLAKGRKRKYIATKKSIDLKHFDNATGHVLRGNQNSVKLNAFFKRQMTRLDDIIIDIINDGEEPTFEKVETKFLNNNELDFISFALEELKQQRAMLSPKTYIGYKNRLENLRKIRPILPFNTINYDFLTKLRYQLIISDRKANGYYQDFATIKKFYRLAVVRGVAKGNPFENFKLEKEETTKAWLTKEELNMLYSLSMDAYTDKDGKSISITDAEKNSLRHFLFSCFTGIRFGDKLSFNSTHIIDGRIQLKTSKTGKIINVPFNDQAQALLPFVLGRGLKQSNSRVNTDLSTCIKALKINKHITYHSSRHTFAINCLLLGIDLITVRDWLGHNSVTTTEIYAKIAAQYKDESMKRFSGFLG